MRLLIDNADYIAALDAAQPLRITRRLNRPSTLAATLIAATPDVVVPAAGARVVVERDDGVKLFTGYLDGEPEYEYLGWSHLGPAYRYLLAATSDEVRLDRKRLPERPAFIARTAGDALRRLAEDLLPGAFAVTQVADLDLLPAYTPNPQLAWSEHAAAIALRARAAYRAHDAALALRPIGETSHTLAESSPAFTPGALKLASPPSLVNDATIIGRSEPRLYVKDYFLGDEATLRFDLSHIPFTRRTRVLFDEEFSGAALDTLRWDVADPTAALGVSGGRVNVTGGTGALGATTLAWTERIELAGALLLQHGEFSFAAPSDLIAGGLYPGELSQAGCLAGFRITPSAGESQLQALVEGVATGTPLTTVAGHQYVLTTRFYGSGAFRREQFFHSSGHPAGSPRGGAALPGSVRVILAVRDIDPAVPGSEVATATVLYDGVIAAAPELCRYALLNVAAAQCATAYTRVARVSDALVRTQRPSEAWRTRLVGPLVEGAECQVFDFPQLQFFAGSVPVANESIVVRYRSRGRSVARVRDEASIAAHAQGNDDGVRATVRYVAAPPPRTAADCEHAALALLDDVTQPAWTGQYEVWSDFLPGGPASDVWPGDALAVNVPSRGAVFTAIVREVALECAGGEAQYALRFANEAALPLTLQFDAALLSDEPELTAAATAVGQMYLADVSEAELVAITSTTVDVDCGIDPPAGGGFEVRRADRNWGPDADRELVGRFPTRTFQLTRPARSADFYIRQYDAGSPPKYSRYSALLHVDRPL